LILWVAVLTTKKIKKSIQISELFTFQMLEATACCRTAVNRNTLSRHLELKVQKWSRTPMTSYFIVSKNVATWLQIQRVGPIITILYYNTDYKINAG
jgi:hypothetical protein